MEVTRIQTGSGSPEGANSAYLVPDRGLVVDPGPPGDDHWSALVEGVSGSGLDLEDVEAVFVTHWHVDHAGLSVRLAEAADATLHMHADDAPLVGDYARERARRLDRDADRLAEWGVPAHVVETRRDRDRPTRLPDSYPVVPMEAGDRLAGLDLLDTPGHTLGHAALADHESGHLFGGDVLLPTYTSNVGGGDTRLDDPLGTYLDTLDRLEALEWTAVDPPAVTVHPGHGARVDFPDRIAAIRAHHAERAGRVLGAVESAGTATPWAIARELFGELEGVHVKMGAGEAAAHLRRLHAVGDVSLVGEAPLRYAPGDG